MFASVAALLVACTSDGPTSSVPDGSLPKTPFVISEPAPVALPGTAGQSPVPREVWVSLPPGTLPNADGVDIRNHRTDALLSAQILGGGFDPVAIDAAVGDTLELTVRRLAVGGTTAYLTMVPEAAPPRVVRTDPPRHKRDVPLNAFIMVTFSEPMDSASVTTSLTLRKGKTVVPGSVTVLSLGGAPLLAAFTPSSTLEPLTDYELEVGTAARDLDGDSLAAPVLADFTTGADSTGTPPDTTTQPPLLGMAVFLSTPPNNTTRVVGVPLPAVSITGCDTAGTCDTTYTGIVTLALGAHPAGATLSGTTTVQMVDGAATVTDLSVDVEGVYTLVASAPGAAAGTSGAFQVCAHLCWEGPLAPMPTPRSAVGVAVVGASLYAIGGVDTSFAPSAAVEAYDPATNTWSIRAPMPTARYGFGIGVVNGIIYVAGGVTASDTTAIVEAYDPATDTWSSRQSMPWPTAFPASGSLNGILYLFGGQVQDATIVDSVLAYNPVTNGWSGRVPLPVPDARAGVGVFDGLLYVIGGLDYYWQIRVYDPATYSWTTRTPSNSQTGCGCWIGGPTLPAIAALPGTGILVAAGTDGAGLTAPYGWGIIYDPVTNAYFGQRPIPMMREWWTINGGGYVWTHSPTLPSAGVVNGEVYLVGYETYRFIP